MAIMRRPHVFTTKQADQTLPGSTSSQRRSAHDPLPDHRPRATDIGARTEHRHPACRSRKTPPIKSNICSATPAGRARTPRAKPIVGAPPAGSHLPTDH